ncbi:SDR family NAD(P)-dependent oxidoreductase [Paracoccus litorisediminis]|jgi:short-subunit dehydrogenase|uniref:SDR family NAD(P)-dependent oxidoreductase n=1 Tax=Paracoccus litorisediminis TaxID=2006130 RepID=A0A844HVA7_9RHOB|nr:SDR family NAD(P)-dependent oxidoreductase [Paracoccus litorisediminis]MTH62404.1 SDR family NAD(P)-dependent oxidoreductase [Paracoccus litorisediminis]
MSGKIVLITGAGSGIGRALALEADRLGHRLILVGRREANLRNTAAGLAGKARIVLADVTTPDGREVIRAAAADEGLDILINNAGRLASGRIDGLKDQDLAELVATNIAAPVVLTRDLLPALERQHGQVVNIGSVFGDIGFPYFALYSASKFALRGFSEALRRELAPRGISVTYIAPRATRTAATESFRSLIGPMAMALDDPETVACHAWRAITARKREQFPKSRERFFVALQRLRPQLIDRALARMAKDPAVIAAARHAETGEKA